MKWYIKYWKECIICSLIVMIIMAIVEVLKHGIK